MQSRTIDGASRHAPNTAPAPQIETFASAPLPYVDPAAMPDIYAVTGKGTCMLPLYADGSLLVGDKRKEPQPGDAVFLYFHRDVAFRYGMPGWVKRLVHGSLAGPLITVEQLNPPRRYVIPAGHVTAMHRCVGTATSMGDDIAAWKPSQGREG